MVEFLNCKKGEQTHCIDCGELIDKHRRSLCRDCRSKRMQQARASNKCVLCFDKTQLEKELCIECLKMWGQFAKTLDENDEFRRDNEKKSNTQTDMV